MRFIRVGDLDQDGMSEFMWDDWSTSDREDPTRRYTLGIVSGVTFRDFIGGE